ncbi:MAG TPA: YraN family protein [Eoetvoesiella sp.]
MTSDEQIVYDLALAAQKKAIRRRHRRLTRPKAIRLAAPAFKLSPTQQQGHRAENRAKRYLEAAGLIVLGQNLRCKMGEIDLVCRDRATLAFIEVRHRRSARYGGAAASVNRAKQQRLIRAAYYLLPQLTQRYFQGATPPCRFDVITIEPDGLAWFKHAFEAN